MRCAACFKQLIHRAFLGFADEIDADEQDYRFVFLNTSDKPYFLNEEDQYPFGWRLEKSNQQAGRKGAKNRQKNYYLHPFITPEFTEQKDIQQELSPMMICCLMDPVFITQLSNVRM